MDHAAWCNANPPRLTDEEYACMAIEEPIDPKSLPAGVASAVDGMLAKRYPTLLEYLASESYSSGRPRERAALTVFAESGYVKSWLNDRDQERSLWVTATSLEEALASLEKKLVSGNPDWVMQKGKKGKGTR